MTFDTWRWWGRQPHAPVAFTLRNVPVTHFHYGLSRPQGPGMVRRKYVTEKSSDTTVNWSWDRLTSSALTTTLPQALWASWRREKILSPARHSHNTSVIKPTTWAILGFVANNAANTTVVVWSPLTAHINCSTHLCHSAATPTLCWAPVHYQHMHRYSCSHGKHWP
jgi:hypothetical protein